MLICLVLIILANVVHYYLKRQSQQARPPIRTYGAAEVVAPSWRAWVGTMV